MEEECDEGHEWLTGLARGAPRAADAWTRSVNSRRPRQSPRPDLQRGAGAGRAGHLCGH